MSVRRTDGVSWKIHVCSRNKWTLLENYKKVAPGKKRTDIFEKLSRWLLLKFLKIHRFFESVFFLTSKYILKLVEIIFGKASYFEKTLILQRNKF